MKRALRSSSDVWCRVGLVWALFPDFGCARKPAKFPFLCKPIWPQLIPIWSQSTASHLFALVSSPNLYLLCCHMWHVCEYAIRYVPVQSQMHTVDGLCARQTINHLVHDAGKKSCVVNMPFGCCNYCRWWINIGTCVASMWANLMNFYLVLYPEGGSIAEMSVKALLNSIDFFQFLN